MHGRRRLHRGAPRGGHGVRRGRTRGVVAGAAVREGGREGAAVGGADPHRPERGVGCRVRRRRQHRHQRPRRRGRAEDRGDRGQRGRPLPAALVGEYAPDDLAVVRVDGAGLRPAAFGDSAKLRTGQIVLAMGNPLGLSGSVTNGIVSALGRTVTTRREGAFPGATIANAIQTSAPINPGNSGGALVTLNGEVIGIPTAAASDPQIGGTAAGIGFATPSGTVRTIVPQLIKEGRVRRSGRAALGVSIQTVISGGDPRQTAVGVVEVTPGGPADKAGIRPGDSIRAVNGTPTPNTSALAEVLAGLRPGDTAQVRITTAEGADRTVEVTLGQLP
ncbi:S1C family serine protease [Actinomadura keratinilytica]|uniref:S1C family serine protease n=1 Tax=Actinomadura keratinilytica TaxID=547461 RepID=UPI0036227A7E